MSTLSDPPHPFIAKLVKLRDERRREATELRARLEDELGGDHSDIFPALMHTPFESGDINVFVKEIHILEMQIEWAKKELEKGLKERKEGRKEGKGVEGGEGGGEGE